MIIALAISGYRSIRNLIVPLERLTVVTGNNGTGKSSFYRSLRLLADVGQGRIISSLAQEGGLTSARWAGPETISQAMKRGDVPIEGIARKNAVSLKLGFATEDYGYAIDMGLPEPVPYTKFGRDPEIKTEAIWIGEAMSRRNTIAERRGPTVTVLSDKGRREMIASTLPAFDSMLGYAGPQEATMELLAMRERMRNWRFYDNLRTDSAAPSRLAQVGTRTTVLAGDGADVAAAIQTIREIGDADGLDAAIDQAFAGSRLEIEENRGYFELLMRQPGLLRPLRAAEFSEGTLRYVLLVAALLTPRPPSLLVLNEPETGLHPDLIKPLEELIAAASTRSQIIVVSHSMPLVSALTGNHLALGLHLTKELGETIVKHDGMPAWHWPER